MLLLIYLTFLTFLIYYKDYKITDIDERHLLNTYIKNNTTSEDLIFEIRKPEKLWNKYEFDIAPYMFWRDYLYNERNINTGIVKISITYSVPQLGVENKALQISLYVI